jgi:hypothetical protein
MSEPQPQQPAGQEDARRTHFARNYFLGVFNGTMIILGNSLISPSLVLAAFVYERTGSEFLVGLLPALGVAGSRLPQLYVSSLIEHRESKKLFYIGATLLRLVTLPTMGLLVLFSSRLSSTTAMAAMFTAYGLFAIGQGGASIPFFDMLASAIGPSRVGGVFATRHFFGHILAMLAGLFVVQRILNEFGGTRDAAYALLIGLAWLVLAAGWVSFSLVREVGGTAAPHRRSVRAQVVSGISMFREQSNYRGLFWLFFLGPFNGLALTFYVPYGVERLGVVGLSGVFITVISASRVASSLLWGRISDRSGNRILLIVSGVLYMLSALIALAAPAMPSAVAWHVPGTEVTADLPLIIFLFALCVFGLGQQAGMVGTSGYMVESAPDDRRPSYLAFLNTVTVPVAFVAPVLGLLVGLDPLGLVSVFIISAAGGLLTLVVSLRLTEVRHTVPDGVASGSGDLQEAPRGPLGMP